MENNKGEKHMRKLVLFQTGSTAFALDRNSISRIRPIPDGTAGGKGRVQQQIIKDDENRSLLLVDLGAASNLETAPPCPPQAEMIVIKKSPPLALLADQVQYTLEANGDQMGPLPPVFGDTARAYFPEVLCTENHVALVIDTDALAVFNTYSLESFEEPKARTEQRTEINHEVADAQTPKSPPSPSAPLGGDALEFVVGEKLRKIIQQRVQEVTAETVARLLKQQMEQPATPSQPWV